MRNYTVLRESLNANGSSHKMIRQDVWQSVHEAVEDIQAKEGRLPQLPVRHTRYCL